MPQRIILSLFTFWLGISGTLSAPLALFGQGFNVVGVAHAQIADVCGQLSSMATSKRIAANQAVADFDTSFTTEESVSREVIADKANDYTTNRTNDQVMKEKPAEVFKSITINALVASRQRVYGRGDAATTSLAAYWEAVHDLGLQRPVCSQYSAVAGEYNQLVDRFNGLAARTFPVNPTQYSTQARNYVGTKYKQLYVYPDLTQGINEGVASESAANGNLQLKPALKLPATADQVKASDPKPELQVRKPIDTSFDTANTPIGTDSDCGLEKLEPFGTESYIAKQFNNLVKPLLALACFAITAMYSFMMVAANQADCLISGAEIPEVCPRAEQLLNNASQTPQTQNENESLDVPENFPETVPETTTPPGTSPATLPNTNDTVPVPGAGLPS